MRNILAVDTASKLMGMTLSSNKKLYQAEINEGFTHSENLLPMIKNLLDEAGIVPSDLDLLICSRGPGSFTGLRIGMATLKGMASALDIPLVSIPTMDIYASSINNNSGVVMPVLDARKRCFYTALYRNKIKESEDLDLNPDEIIDLVQNETSIILTGIDADVLYDKVKSDNRFKLDNEYEKNYSSYMIEIGLNQYKIKGSDSKDQGPLYIRKSEAELNLIKKEKQ